MSETENPDIVEVIEKHGAVSNPWHRQVAVTSLILAMLVAVAGVLAGMTAHDELMKRTREIIDVSRMGNDKVEAELSKIRNLLAGGSVREQTGGKSVTAGGDSVQRFHYDISRLESGTRLFGHAHEILAIAVTLMSLGISLSGISIVVGMRWMYLCALVMGGCGVLTFGYGIYNIFF